MRDQLLDLVQHTYDLGFISLIKITGTQDQTRIYSMAEDKSVVLHGEFAKAVTEFTGTFGMPNLNKLKILLNLPEYRENAKLSVSQRASDQLLDGINFENSLGDFHNSYRFMSAKIIDEQLKTYNLKQPAWCIEFEPSVNSIQRLKMQAQANAEETVFRTETKNNDLKFHFGNHSSHAGNFVFQPDVGGILKNSWSWPINQIIGILSLAGDKYIRISDVGAMQITVNSGLATYNYSLSAYTK